MRGKTSILNLSIQIDPNQGFGVCIPRSTHQNLISNNTMMGRVGMGRPPEKHGHMPNLHRRPQHGSWQAGERGTTCLRRAKGPPYTCAPTAAKALRTLPNLHFALRKVCVRGKPGKVPISHVRTSGLTHRLIDGLTHVRSSSIRLSHRQSRSILK